MRGRMGGDRVWRWNTTCTCQQQTIRLTMCRLLEYAQLQSRLQTTDSRNLSLPDPHIQHRLSVIPCYV